MALQRLAHQSGQKDRSEKGGGRRQRLLGCKENCGACCSALFVYSYKRENKGGIHGREKGIPACSHHLIPWLSGLLSGLRVAGLAAAIAEDRLAGWRVWQATCARAEAALAAGAAAVAARGSTPGNRAALLMPVLPPPRWRPPRGGASSHLCLLPARPAQLATAPASGALLLPPIPKGM